MEELKQRAYPDDAQWFITHEQRMYLAFCTPEGKDDVFILTENAYGIHEGPVSVKIDPITGEETMTAYTEFHVLAVIAPRLTIVLRSMLLPNLEEDVNEDIKLLRETMYQWNANWHNFPPTANSLLEDLPVSKASNSYTRLVYGQRVLVEGEDGSRSSHHKFCFRFFPISDTHVNKINSIMLEESHNISKIVLATSTEHYAHYYAH
jgi:Protein of unknown function (DUF4238)